MDSNISENNSIFPKRPPKLSSPETDSKPYGSTASETSPSPSGYGGITESSGRPWLSVLAIVVAIVGFWFMLLVFYGGHG